MIEGQLIEKKSLNPQKGGGGGGKALWNCDAQAGVIAEYTPLPQSNSIRCATGLQFFLCSGVGPRRDSAARCSGEQYPLCRANP